MNLGVGTVKTVVDADAHARKPRRTAPGRAGRARHPQSGRQRARAGRASRVRATRPGRQPRRGHPRDPRPLLGVRALRHGNPQPRPERPPRHRADQRRLHVGAVAARATGGAAATVSAAPIPRGPSRPFSRRWRAGTTRATCRKASRYCSPATRSWGAPACASSWPASAGVAWNGRWSASRPDADWAYATEACTRRGWSPPRAEATRRWPTACRIR